MLLLCNYYLTYRCNAFCEFCDFADHDRRSQMISIYCMSECVYNFNQQSIELLSSELNASGINS